MAVPAAAARPFVEFEVPLWVWGAFLGGVATLLALDLLLVHRRPHAIGLREAAVESTFWIALGIGLGGVVWWWQGWPAASEYLTAYVIEKSLSVDNVFVWAVIFSYFRVPAQYQFRVLFWGIFGALVMRGIFIVAGVQLIETFDWVLYVFGAFLLYTAYKVWRHHDTEIDPEHTLAFRLARRVLPTTGEYDGQKLFTRRDGKRVATPLFIVLLVVESTDVVFAVDSVPAVLAISREEFIVYSSNAMAILGLRALYFLLGGMVGRFRYLHHGLAAILAFVGIKMLIQDVYHVPTWLSLSIITAILAAAIGASLRADRREARTGHPTSP